MNTWVRKSFKVGVLSAGVLLFAGTAANADWNSAGNSGVLSGNQINAQVQAPIDICGNGVGVFGNAGADCVGGSSATVGSAAGSNSGAVTANRVMAAVKAHRVGAHQITAHQVKTHQVKTHHILVTQLTTESTQTTEATTLVSTGNSGVLTGNQVNALIQVPIDVCGNAIGVLGSANASCVGGATATAGGGSGATMSSGFNSGILSGNQINGLVQIPINVCGNAIGLFGNASASCVGGSTANAGGSGGNGGNAGGYGGGSNTPGTGTGACSPMLTSLDNSGVLTGNQVNLVAQVPIDISGNAIGVLGNTSASSVGGASANC